MCNLSERIEDKAIQKTTFLKLIDAVDKMVKNLDVSIERACEILEHEPEAYYQAQKDLGLTDK